MHVGKDYSYDLPKDILYVKLNTSITQYQKDIIKNGLRSFLNNDLSFLNDAQYN